MKVLQIFHIIYCFSNVCICIFLHREEVRKAVMEDKHKGVKKGKKIYIQGCTVRIFSRCPPPRIHFSLESSQAWNFASSRLDVRLTYLCVLITRLFCPADWLPDILVGWLFDHLHYRGFFFPFFFLLPLLFNLRVEPFRNERGYSKVAVLQVYSAPYPQATSFSNIKLSGQRPLQLPLQMARKFLQKDHQNRPCNLYSLAC